MWMSSRAKASLLLGIALLVVWFVLLRPLFLGGPASYIIISGRSMEPTLRSGDLALILREDTYTEGDIVAFPVQGGVVVHRIVGGTATEGYVIQGDNKEAPDMWRPTADQILGKMWLHVPGAGRYVLALRQPLVFALVIGAIAALFLLPLPRRESRRKRRKRENKLKLLRRRRERALGRWLPVPAARLVSRLC